MTERLRRWIEHWLPWYDRAAEAARDRRTEALRLRSIDLRMRVERMTDAEVREAYRLAGRRVRVR